MMILRILTMSVVALSANSSFADSSLTLHTRFRDAAKGNPVRKTVQWDPHKTAIIICDMWDKHWCQGASNRVAEMAPVMNEVVKTARSRGVFIIHAPSDTMKYYEGTPERMRAQEAPTD